MRPALILLIAAALAGCGGDGGPRLERADAAPLVALAHRIPHESACAQARDIAALRTRVTALVNAGRVPAKLQESLSSGVNALAAQTPTCLPPVAATAPAEEGDRGNGHAHGRKKHGHGEGD